MSNEQLKGHLDMLLLGVLKKGRAHGYEVIRRLADDSDGTFDLPEGTVYPALHRLEKLGLLASSWDATEGRRRRVYEITGAGATALRDRRAEFKRFAAGVQAVIA